MAKSSGVDLALLESKRCALKGRLKLCAKIPAIDDSVDRYDPKAAASSQRL